MKALSALLALALLLPACSKKPEPSSPAAAETAPAGDALSKLRAEIDALQKLPEHQAAEITVQHILVGVTNQRMPTVKRTPAEAEKIAAELLVRIRAGEDFDTLVKNHTDDSHPGIYTMSAGEGSRTPGVYPRSGMAAAFGDVGWRLQVGEVGVAPHDPAKSPFGYHIVKRLK